MSFKRSTAATSLVAAFLVAGVAGGVGAQSTPPDMTGGLDGTDWGLGSMATGGTTTPIASGTVITLEFNATEAFGSGGCNRYFGPYTTDGKASLTFGQFGQTRMLCDEATNTMETNYLVTLGKVASYVMTPDTLTLSDGSGAAVLTYGPASPTTIEGPWLVTGYNNQAVANAAVVSPVPDTHPTVAFGPDGIVEGQTGCNSFSGGYSVHGDQIAIGPLMQTLMFCEGPVGDQEIQLTTALQAATTWKVSANMLELRDATSMQVNAVSAIGH